MRSLLLQSPVGLVLAFSSVLIVSSKARPPVRPSCIRCRVCSSACKSDTVPADSMASQDIEKPQKSGRARNNRRPSPQPDSATAHNNLDYVPNLEGKAKRKVGLHVAYCGTGYSGKGTASCSADLTSSKSVHHSIPEASTLLTRPTLISNPILQAYRCSGE